MLSIVAFALSPITTCWFYYHILVILTNEMIQVIPGYIGVTQTIPTKDVSLGDRYTIFSQCGMQLFITIERRRLHYLSNILKVTMTNYRNHNECWHMRYNYDTNWNHSIQGQLIVNTKLITQNICNNYLTFLKPWTANIIM